MTNALGRPTFRLSQADAYNNDHGRLICRFKLWSEMDINLEDPDLSGWNAIGKCGYITRLTEAEADKGYGEDDLGLMTSFRGVEESLDGIYRYGDICCGAGGATVGAEMAGFVVKFGMDRDVDSMQTWRLNRNPAHDSVGFVEDAFNFNTQSSQTELLGNPIDLLHMSIPCQPYSPAHTVPGKNDEANEAMTSAVSIPLQNLRPRVATLEETDGMIRTFKHRDWFFLVLWQFLSEQYNVSWNVLEALEYGCVSKRSRLVILASW